MEWVEENKFYSGIILLAVLVLGVGGYFFFNQKSGYEAAKAGYDGMGRKVKALKSGKPYPKQENLDGIEEVSEDYVAAGNELHTAIAQLQVPLNKEINDSTYRDILKKNVIDVQKAASSKGIQLPEAFYLGLDTKTPKPKELPYQDFRRRAMVYLLSILIDADIKELETLELSPLTETDINPGGTVIRPHGVKLCIESSGEALIDVINKLSNATPNASGDIYFFLINVLKIENEQEVGPLRIAKENRVAETAPSSGFDIGGEDGAFPGESDETDAEIILGKENVKCCLILNLMRFGTLEEVATTNPAAAKGASNRNKRKRNR